MIHLITTICVLATGECQTSEPAPAETMGFCQIGAGYILTEMKKQDHEKRITVDMHCIDTESGERWDAPHSEFPED